MGKQIDLLENYPKPKRDLTKRLSEKTDEDRLIARKFGKDFFDGTRSQGYGGYYYNPRFWSPVVPTFKKYWQLTSKNSLLDVGCGKGFMIYDIQRLIPGIKVKGIDISEYSIANAVESVKDSVSVANAKKLPFEDNSYDIVISINTVHNLEIEECAKALQEIERVRKEGAFITVDAYRNEDEKQRMMAWNLTAKTIMSVEDWIEFFKKVGYNGDYFWFIP